MTAWEVPKLAELYAAEMKRQHVETDLLIATPAWHAAHDVSVAAVIALDGVGTAAETEGFAVAKRELEATLRARWEGKTRADVKTDPVLAAYDRYVKRFGQTYHVQMQIESIALKGKPIPARSPLVEVLFMAELATGVLAAGHDLAEATLPITVDSATGDETYTRYDGAEERCKAGDQLMRDAGGNILTSIAQGPTTHARLTTETAAVVYCLYLPPGLDVELAEAALAAVARNLYLCAPEAEERGRSIVAAGVA